MAQHHKPVTTFAPNFDWPFGLWHGFDRVVVRIGTAPAGWELGPTVLYRTNYGKITSIHDRLFQYHQIKSDFCRF